MRDRKAYMKVFRQTHKEQIAGNKKEYRRLHKEKIAEYMKVYRAIHRKEQVASQKAYYLIHKDEIMARHKEHPEIGREANRRWCLTHPEGAGEKMKRWRGAHPEEAKERSREFKRTLKGRKIVRRYNAKRKDFGFIPLNEYLLGTEGHHIDTTRVVYIPEELHIDNRHSVTKNKGMETINTLAFNWLEAEELYDNYVKI